MEINDDELVFCVTRNGGRFGIRSRPLVFPIMVPLGLAVALLDACTFGIWSVLTWAARCTITAALWAYRLGRSDPNA